MWFSNSCALLKDTCVTCGVGYIPYRLLLLWVLSLLPVSLLVGLKVFTSSLCLVTSQLDEWTEQPCCEAMRLLVLVEKSSRDAKQEGGRVGDPRSALFYGL